MQDSLVHILLNSSIPWGSIRKISMSPGTVDPVLCMCCYRSPHWWSVLLQEDGAVLCGYGVKWEYCSFYLVLFMSDDIAIQVRGLGKKYPPGGPQEKISYCSVHLVNIAAGSPTHGSPNGSRPRPSATDLDCIPRKSIHT